MTNFHYYARYYKVHLKDAYEVDSDPVPLTKGPAEVGFFGKLYRWWTRSNPAAAAALECLDEEDGDDGQQPDLATGVPLKGGHVQDLERKMLEKADAPPKFAKPANYGRFAARLAREVKSKMGSQPKHSEANRLVAWDLLGKLLEERDVRKCDRAKFQSLALPLVFVPTKWDLEASEMLHSMEVKERVDSVRYGQKRWWQWRVNPLPITRE